MKTGRLSVGFFRMGLADPGVRARFLGVYQSQFRGLEEAGASVVFTEDVPPEECDAVVTVASPPLERNLRLLLSRTSAPIVLYVPPAEVWFPRWLPGRFRDRILFVYGTFSSRRTASLYERAGITYRKLPFGSDPALMRPVGVEPNFEVVFVGGLGHRKGADAFLRPLIEKLGVSRMLLLGSGYERYGIPPQQLAYGPALNMLYQMGKVCINFHAPEQKRGPDERVDLNNRAFDLAMAGRPQVCDNVSELREYFSAEEVPGSDDPALWLQQVLGLLDASPSERAAFAERARHRALREHTWAARGREMLGWVTEALARRRRLQVPE